MARVRRIIVISALATVASSPSFLQEACASSFYYEAQAGVAKMVAGAPFFDASAPSVADMGIGLTFSVAYSFSGGSAPADFQLGLQYRLATGSNGTTQYYATQTAYPLLRLQLSKLYLGAGATPFVWRRVNSTSGVDLFSGVTGALAYFGEAGLLWSVTPEFSLGAVGGAEFISTGGSLSPSPTLTGTVLLRFYFGFSSGGGSSRSSSEYKGWRYPFGREIH